VWNGPRVWELSVGLTIRPLKNYSVTKPSKKPRNWINNGKQLDSESGLHLKTWNIRTLNKPEALKYVLEAYNIYKMDILALQEIRWPNNENLKKDTQSNRPRHINKQKT